MYFNNQNIITLKNKENNKQKNLKFHKKSRGLNFFIIHSLHLEIIDINLFNLILAVILIIVAVILNIIIGIFGGLMV